MIYNESKFNTKWETLPLSKLGEFKRGKSKHRPRNDQKLFEGGTYPLIQTGEIKAANLLIKSHNAAYNEEGLKQSKMWPAGTLAITIAANIAETGILAYPMCFPDSCVGFNADKEKTTELFMHYVFTYIKRSIQSSAVGSIQDNINIEMLTALNFKIPKKPIQDLIVDLLSAIDYKIELNNDINTELENLAKTIYNYWFVQFDFPNAEGKPYKTSDGEMEWSEELKREIPKGWEAKPLDKFGEFKNGINYEGDVVGDKIVRIVNVRDISDSNYFILKDNLDEISLPEKDSSKYLVHENDILIARSGTPGATRLIHKDIVDVIYCGFIIRYNVNEERMKKYLFFNLKRIEDALTTKSAGTILKNVSQDTLKELLVASPDDNTIKRFNEKMNPIFESIYSNSKQNQELIKLRDFLLPMLMNGQVKVKSEVKEQLSMAAEPQVKYGK
jgi:type I restriction enzyme S subunit